MIIRLENISCAYNNMRAINHFNLDVEKGSVTAILGANGAGKSSLIMAISGHVKVMEGQMVYDGKNITAFTPMQRVKLGIALVPEGRRLFKNLSVYENLVIGGYITSNRESRVNIDKVVSIFPLLGKRFRQKAGSLSGGEQQMLAIGRALMPEPKLLMIDELSLGLMPKAVNSCYDVIKDLNGQGLSILLVEQSTQRALDVSDRIIVLESGNTVWNGSSQEARESSSMIDSILGLKETG